MINAYNVKNFTKGVERLINPMDVGTLHFMQGFNKLLPRAVQEMFIKSSSKSKPFMGFVVEPYAYFLCYEIEDLEMAKNLLPTGFSLVKTKIFDYDEPKYYCIFGCFTAHTSAFWGSRVEFYIIAEDDKTGLMSWIIVDYDSNTISYDKKYGLKSPNSTKAVVSTTHRGTLIVDVTRDDKSRAIVFESDITVGKFKPMDYRLWLEGNLSIGYGRELSEGGDASIFSLKFDPLEVEKGLEMPLDSLNLEVNSWFPGLFKKTPSKLACFPYAQHFVSDSPGHFSSVETQDELVKAIEEIDFENIKVLSTKPFKTMFLLGGAVSFLITVTLLALLVFTDL